ncbi:hypothetical protein F511_42270 [Dorcoceras hygrometricum]|uniref:Uncharacterized protein n=1 Tax=Dorcoceras hygrometricum TaxID=472368 RepID=A0A2Z7A6P6_9LAMI|nr:hypothetical protein F511_42270 [Dorcoceras hygrometricum]
MLLVPGPPLTKRESSIHGGIVPTIRKVVSTTGCVVSTIGCMVSTTPAGIADIGFTSFWPLRPGLPC